jgi:hypothetical protein
MFLSRVRFDAVSQRCCVYRFGERLEVHVFAGLDGLHLPDEYQ